MSDIHDLVENLKKIIVEFLLSQHNIQSLDDQLERKLYDFLFNFVDVYILTYLRQFIN